MARAMKDSGIEWIGNIPSHWKVRRLGTLGKFYSSGIDKKIVEDELPVKIVNYVDVYKNKKYELYNSDYMEVTTTMDKIEQHSLKKGDLIFTPSSETIEDIGISALVMEDLLNTAYSYHVLRFVFDECVDEKYKKYLCNNHLTRAYFSKCATGTIRKTLNRNDMKNAYVILPPIEEQERIASFIDEKVAVIDTIISKTKASIEEYKKYKNAVIAETITKGLDKTVSMKESGIEWVGKIPSHWEIHTLSQVFMQLKNKNSDLSETNLLSLSYGKVKRKDINSSDGLLPESFDGYNIIDKNDIVLRLTDLQNDHKSLRVGHVKERGIITSAYVTLRCKEDIATDYYYYFLHTFDIFKGFYGMGAGVRQGLNYEGIRSMKILSPDIKEQQKVVEYLNVKCAEIDALIAKKEALGEEMEEYRKSLIYEYVTGKKEVL